MTYDIFQTLRGRLGCYKKHPFIKGVFYNHGHAARDIKSISASYTLQSQYINNTTPTGGTLL
jgi:hypothetical protein